MVMYVYACMFYISWYSTGRIDNCCWFTGPFCLNQHCPEDSYRYHIVDEMVCKHAHRGEQVPLLWCFLWCIKLQQVMVLDLVDLIVIYHPLHAAIQKYHDYGPYKIQPRQKRGYSVATFDLEIHPSMNFLSSAGFLLLGLKTVLQFSILTSSSQVSPMGASSRGPRCLEHVWPRLCSLGNACSRDNLPVNPEYIRSPRSRFCFMWKQNDFKVSGLNSN